MTFHCEEHLILVINKYIGFTPFVYLVKNMINYNSSEVDNKLDNISKELFGMPCWRIIRYSPKEIVCSTRTINIDKDLISKIKNNLNGYIIDIRGVVRTTPIEPNNICRTMDIGKLKQEIREALILGDDILCDIYIPVEALENNYAYIMIRTSREPL